MTHSVTLGLDPLKGIEISIAKKTTESVEPVLG